METIRLVVVDDHSLVRLGLRVLLSSEPDFLIVGEAASGREAVAAVAKFEPDVAVMDLVMPEVDGIEATRQITRACPATRVLVLSSYSDDEHVEQALAAGAAAYVLKESAATELVRAIREVHRGKEYFSPAIALRLHERASLAFDDATAKERPGPEAALTGREAQVWQLIVEGFLPRQIAEALSVRISAVGKYRRSLMRKLKAGSVGDLVYLAASSQVAQTPSGY